jgi:hypothetical protein
MIEMVLIVVPFVAIIAALVWMFRRSPSGGSSGYQSGNETSLYNGSSNHTQTPTVTHTHHHHHGGNNGGGGW